MASLYDELQWRGLVYEATEELADVLGRERVTGYIGFDPTASSLHIGSLLPMIALARLQRFGHSPIAIAGGGTGMIGDPKPTQERSLLSPQEIARNLEGIKPQSAWSCRSPRRRRGRSSGRRKRARSGSIRRAPRRSASTSSGSTATTATLSRI